MTFPWWGRTPSHCGPCRCRGNTTRLEPVILDMLQNGPRLTSVRALLAVLLALLDEKSSAVGILDELRFLIDDLPVRPRWAGTLAIIGVAASLLDDSDAAERVYRQLLPSAGYYEGDGSGTIFSTGSNARAVGEVARLAHQGHRPNADDRSVTGRSAVGS